MKIELILAHKINHDACNAEQIFAQWDPGFTNPHMQHHFRENQTFQRVQGIASSKSIQFLEPCGFNKSTT
eukprot:1154611-Pelagomonas_calceolata.AAC.2